MIEYTESVAIEALPADVWDYVADVSQWWLASNPDHISIRVEGSGPIMHYGTEVAFEEEIAGVRAQANGSITEYIPGIRISWEGVTEYRYFGLPFNVHEGISWSVESNGRGTKLSTHIRTKFSSGFLGRIFGWHEKKIRKLLELNRAHTKRELEYLKTAIEAEFHLAGRTAV